MLKSRHIHKGRQVLDSLLSTGILSGGRLWGDRDGAAVNPPPDLLQLC